MKSQKEVKKLVEIKVFLINCMDPDQDPSVNKEKIMTDPDPKGRKT